MDSEDDDVNDCVDQFESIQQQLDELIELTRKTSEAWRWVPGTIIGFFVLLAIFDFLDSRTFLRIRYSLRYGAAFANVQVDKKPHDCDFFHAPIGDKDCHYDKDVSVTRYGHNAAGVAVVSYDNGKTWSAADFAIPEYSPQVDVGWHKADGD